MMEDFYRENYPIVYGYLLDLCGDAALAEELTAATFCRAVEKIDTYDERFQPSTWLCTIGRNLFLNECRRKRKLTGLEAAEYITAPSAEATVLERKRWRISGVCCKPFPTNISRCSSCAWRVCPSGISALRWEKQKTGRE